MFKLREIFIQIFNFNNWNQCETDVTNSSSGSTVANRNSIRTRWIMMMDAPDSSMKNIHFLNQLKQRQLAAAFFVGHTVANVVLLVLVLFIADLIGKKFTPLIQSFIHELLSSGSATTPRAHRCRCPTLRHVPSGSATPHNHHRGC